jgi:predicted nucleic acid-binding protein
LPVVDASVLVDYLAGGEHAESSRARLLGAEESLWTPHLADAEVGHVLRRAVIAGDMPQSTARAALADLGDLPLRRAGHVGLLERAWKLRANVTFYDALYVALAEWLDMALLTLDARLAAALRSGGVVDLIQ